jgi:hypothetical protein
MGLCIVIIFWLGKTLTGAIKKPIISISPEKSEMRRIITDDQYNAKGLDIRDIKQN